MANKYQEHSKAPMVDMDRLPKPYLMQRVYDDPRDNSNQAFVNTFSEKARLEEGGWIVIKPVETGDSIGREEGYEYKYDPNGKNTFNGLPATKTRRRV